MDTVRLICPNLTCRALLSVPVSARGKTVRCRQCGTRIRVPVPKEAAPPSADKPATGPQEPAPSK